MTRIDFYILPEGAKPPEGAAMTACKLCDKAVAAGNRVYIHAPRAEMAQTLDSLLWSFRQGGFISHERYTGAALAEPVPAVLIGEAEPPASHQAVMINLSNQAPSFFSTFERVLEIVDGDTAQRAQSRERYKYYRDRGYELASHNL
jgi:DNA polymerase III subunit chi